jgi:hypothetical protein
VRWHCTQPAAVTRDADSYTTVYTFGWACLTSSTRIADRVNELLAPPATGETVAMTLAEIRSRIARPGILGKRLAELLGIPQPNVSGWCTGIRPIPLHHVPAIGSDNRQSAAAHGAGVAAARGYAGVALEGMAQQSSPTTDTGAKFLESSNNRSPTGAPFSTLDLVLARVPIPG